MTARLHKNGAPARTWGELQLSTREATPAHALHRTQRTRAPREKDGRKVSGRTIYLRSGKWRVYVDPRAPVLELVDPASPWNKMRVPLGGMRAELQDAELTELARRPELRLWVDEHAISWRIAMVGPGTAWAFPLRSRHLLFDSEQAWAGIVQLPEDVELGDLTADELREYRNRISDVAGKRRRFRAPAERERRARANPPQVEPAGTELAHTPANQSARADEPASIPGGVNE